MTRLTPVSYQKFEKFLFYVGCGLVRQKGDHRIYKRDGLSRPLVVPAIKDIPIFVIRNNLRILGIDVNTYLGILNQL